MNVIETTKIVGNINQISLPAKNVTEVGAKMGRVLAGGTHGTVYEKIDSAPKRVYKKIPLPSLHNGNEITISRLAGELGVAPKIHDAFVLREEDRNFVIIEMDYAGRSINQLMDDMAEVVKPDITPMVRAEQEMLLTLDIHPKHTVIQVKTTKRPPIHDAVTMIYDNPEKFYFELFQIIKTLAEENIAYTDTHAGNIIPNHGTEGGMKLIDFDAARLTDSVEAAKMVVMENFQNIMHLRNYSNLPDLSEKSEELIEWFGDPADNCCLM